MREKLIDLLRDAHNFRKYVDRADYLLANGVTVQEWISVKDRLPERVVFTYADSCEPSGFGEYLKSGWVLVYTKSGSITSGFLCNDCWDTDNGEDEVTHWMPLPEAPKGE